LSGPSPPDPEIEIEIEIEIEKQPSWKNALAFAPGFSAGGFSGWLFPRAGL
jgi:hypothetical protein